MRTDSHIFSKQLFFNIFIIILSGEIFNERLPLYMLLYAVVMSPEYAMPGHFSVKFDVYSFGVIISKTNSSFDDFDDSITADLDHI